MTISFERVINTEYFELNASVHNQKWLLGSSCLQNFIWRYFITVLRHTERHTQISSAHFVNILNSKKKKIIFEIYTLAEDLLPRWMHRSCTSYSNPVRNTRSYNTWILCMIQDLIIIVGSYPWYTDSMHNTWIPCITLILCVIFRSYA